MEVDELALDEHDDELHLDDALHAPQHGDLLEQELELKKKSENLEF